MADRSLVRERGPEPAQTIYDRQMNRYRERMEQMAAGKVVIKASEVVWELTRQGRLKYLMHAGMWDEVGAPGWSVFVHEIRVHSGKHRHQGGLGIFVLEGEGYTVVDGVQYDWKAGDLIVLPVKPGGCEHQHFNKDPEKPSRWVAFVFDPFKQAIGDVMVQRENSPEWRGP